jgi:hypothetical protein
LSTRRVSRSLGLRPLGSQSRGGAVERARRAGLAGRRESRVHAERGDPVRERRRRLRSRWQRSHAPAGGGPPHPPPRASWDGDDGGGFGPKCSWGGGTDSSIPALARPILRQRNRQETPHSHPTAHRAEANMSRVRGNLHYLPPSLDRWCRVGSSKQPPGHPGCRQQRFETGWMGVSVRPTTRLGRGVLARAPHT